ncbi:MAG: regulatory protein RecX [Polaribacter sp.]|nr:regulatory protein RecX [Polaribacter sp.]
MKKNTYFSVEELKRKLERYCVYQDRCHQEVERKFREFSVIPEAKELIFLHLLEHDFLNEERFSKSYARGKFSIKKWGKQRIVRELKFRDISEYNIKIALKEIDEAVYLSTVYSITEKRNALITEENVFKRRKKLTDFLLRKGYEYDLIYRTVKTVIESR